MMTNLHHLDSVLSRMISLLRLGGTGDWAATLERCRTSLPGDPAGTARTIRRLYGGTGSLNDLVLFKAGCPLQAENEEFDRLRAQLYELVQLRPGGSAATDEDRDR